MAVESEIAVTNFRNLPFFVRLSVYLSCSVSRSPASVSEYLDLLIVGESIE